MANKRIINYLDPSEDLYLYIFFNDETFEFSLMEGVNVYRKDNVSIKDLLLDISQKYGKNIMEAILKKFVYPINRNAYGL